MREKPNLEVKRALYHFSTVAGAVLLSYFIPIFFAKLLLIETCLFYIIFDLLRYYCPRFQQYANSKLLGWYLRPKEKTGRTANVDCVLGITFAYFVFPMDIFRAVILIVAISDPLARICGRAWGTTKLPGIFNKKSWAGSGAFFISAFLIAILFTSPEAALISALIATTCEAMPEPKYWLNDNFNTPAITGAAMFFLPMFL